MERRLASLMRDLDSMALQLNSLLAELSRKSPGLLPSSPGLQAVVDRIHSDLNRSPDLVVRQVERRDSLMLLVVYLDNLVDPAQIDRDILEPLVSGVEPSPFALPVGQVTIEAKWENIIEKILLGMTAVFQDAKSEAWLYDTILVAHRAIERAQTELTVRGPQEGFSEVQAIQMSQLRRRIPSRHLMFYQLSIGQRYPVLVTLAYLDDLVNPSLLHLAQERLSRIRVDTVINGTMLANYLKDHAFSLFPTVRNSERVDLVIWQLLNGKIAILVEGDPFVLWVPVTLTDFYRTSADYTSPWYDTSFIRVIRWLGWLFGIYLPAFYIAITEVNPALVPPPLIVLTAGSHTGLPFTPIVEILVMVLVIEILREAALRLPKALSTTIGTVGAIVVGTAVVKAGFVSPQVIVVMTLTALSFFSAPTYDLMGSWRIVGWAMLISAYIYGVYGIVLASLALTYGLVSETSFGVPYLEPYSPFRPRDWMNTLWRMPWKNMSRRTTEAQPADLRRSASQGPEPPADLETSPKSGSDS